MGLPEPVLENLDPQTPAPVGRRGWLEMAWRRKSLLGLGVVVALALAVIYYAQTTPLYQAKAQILVVKKRPDTVTGIDTRHLAIEDYVATHQTLLRSPTILNRAMDKAGLRDFESLQGHDDLDEFMSKALIVTRNRTSGGSSNNVLELSFRGKKPAECQAILAAIIDSYKDFLDETYRDSSEDTLKLFKNARDVVHVELLKQEEAYRKFRKETPLLMLRGKEGGANLTEARLGDIEKKRTALAIRKSELNSLMIALNDGIKRGTCREALLATISEWSNKLEHGDNPRYYQPLTMQSQLYPLLMEEQKLLETKGDNHPEVQAIRKRIDLTRNFLQSHLESWRNPSDLKSGGTQTAKIEDPLERFQSYLQQQLRQIEMSETLLSDLFRGEFDRAKALTSYDLEDEGFRTSIARTQKQYELLIKRLQETDLVKNVGGYEAKTIAPPTLGKKVHPSGLIIFPAALFAGLLMGFGLTYLAETLDKSFHSVEEVRQRLGLPVLGYIASMQNNGETPQPSLAGDGPPLDPNLCTFYAPQSYQSETFRGVRTALFFNTRGGGHKVIQVTSPNAGDGKSNLASNLAVSIAQSGKRAILVDADLRKPRIHKIFGVSSSVGLASVIAGETELSESIDDSGVPGLSILPCGPIPHNPAELLTSPHFKDLLEALRDQYDFVIVDTPPLLVVSDPSVVAPRVDGVLLTVRFTKDCRPNAERAKDILTTLGANVLGVVINDPEQRTGKNANYAYSYKYNTGYQEPALAAKDTTANS